MSVMEKKVICAPGLGPVLADAPYKRGVVPLMNQNEIGAVECAIEIKCADVVRFRSSSGKRARKSRTGSEPCVAIRFEMLQPFSGS